jgi:nicotinamidase-related amidase
VAEALEGLRPIEKTAFGCLGSTDFCASLASIGRRQLLITGIETHVCVLQTALLALEQGHEVFVARDAVGARLGEEHEAALARLAASGVTLVTTEMAAFELLRDAAAPEFKQLLPLLK